MKPYSMDLRERVLKDCDAGQGTKAVAAKFSVSSAWVRRLKQRRREDGQVAPRPSRNRRAPKLAAHADRIRELVAARPDLTPEEIRRELGLAACVATLWNAVARLGLTVKKKSFAPPGRTGPTRP